MIEDETITETVQSRKVQIQSNAKVFLQKKISRHFFRFFSFFLATLESFIIILPFFFFNKLTFD